VCTSRYERRRRQSGAKAIYDSPEWKAARHEALARKPFCSCGARATEVDHVVAVKDGGHPTAQTNLETCCKPCHSRKTALSDRRWG
jgi:5-methylcytosine-specific restriction protein A